GLLGINAQTVKTGQQLTVNWLDQNAGGGGTTTSWTDSVTVKNTTTGQVVASGFVAYNAATRGALAAAATAAQQFSFTVPDGDDGVGNYQIAVNVDSNNDATEDNGSGTAE